MNLTIKEKFKLYSTIIILFLISRLIFFYLDIQPNHKIFSQMWQVIDLTLLKENLISSLYYLHYQPPLWNLIIGFFVKLFGTDYGVIANIIHIFNILISIISIIIFLNISFLFNLNKFQTYLISFLYIFLSLSYLFYENYLHYTHLTTFFFLLFIYNYINFSKNFELKYEIYIYITATFLVFTWSAFSHPFFIVLIFLTIFYIKYNYKINRSIVIFLIFLIISASLSIKNKVELSFFGNSSWIGLQIIQVLKRWDIKQGLCDMNFKNIKVYEEQFIKKYDFKNKHPALIGDKSKWNNVGMIYKTQKCLKAGIELILKDPINYLSIVKFNFISTHGHFAFDHGFKPFGWEKNFSFFDDIKKYKIANSIKVRSLQIYYFAMYLFFLLIFFKGLLRLNDNNKFNIYKAISSIYFVYLWMIVLTHFFAGFEQERMRHIGHFLHVLFFIILIKNNFSIIKIFKSQKLFN